MDYEGMGNRVGIIWIIKLFMGKKIRYQYLTGALLQPYFQFINRVELGINPISDPRGSRIAQHLYKYANNTKPIFKGQKFQSSLVYDLTSNNSWAIFSYLNGMKQGFHLKHLSMVDFEFEKELIDKIVQCMLGPYVQFNVFAMASRISMRIKQGNDTELVNLIDYLFKGMFNILFMHFLYVCFLPALAKLTDLYKILKEGKIVMIEEEQHLTNMPIQNQSPQSKFPRFSYRCSQCSIPLINYTHILGRQRESNEAFLSYCIVCFTEGEKDKTEKESKWYEYKIIHSNQYKRQGMTMTEAELIVLFQCIQRYGITWATIQRQFEVLTGRKISTFKLSQVFQATYSHLKHQYRLQYKPIPIQIPKQPQPKYVKNKPIQTKCKAGLGKHLSQFNKILQYQEILQTGNILTDDHWGYLLDLLCEYKTQECSSEWIEQLSEQTKPTLFYVKKWQAKSFNHHNIALSIHQQLGRLYSHMYIRQSRKTRGLLPYVGKPKNVELAEHSEMKKLRKLPNIDFAAIIQQVDQLKKRRQVLKAKVKGRYRQPKKIAPFVKPESKGEGGKVNISGQKLIAKKSTQNSRSIMAMQIEEPVKAKSPKRNTRSPAKKK